MIKKDIQYITIPELAKILGLSRITVYKRVKNGRIDATKIGRNYYIPKKYIDIIMGKELSEKDKKVIDIAVKKTIAEYGEVLRLLGKE